jgi:hypothetical protein
LELSVAFREVYNIGILQLWYPSIDIHCFLFHVGFQGGLSISVLKNRAPCHKNLHLEIITFLKKSNMFKPRPPTLFHPPFSRWSVWQLAKRVSRIAETYSKVQLHGFK